MVPSSDTNCAAYSSRKSRERNGRKSMNVMEREGFIPVEREGFSRATALRPRPVVERRVLLKVFTRFVREPRVTKHAVGLLAVHVPGAARDRVWMRGGAH